MRRTETVVIGGGQAGLAMSRCLTDAGVDHVVLERGRVAERWRSGSWDSLRLLTPNWQSRLPGFRYDGPDPDGYMAVPEVVDYLDRYARSFRAPVEEDTTVLAVERAGAGYRVATDRGAWVASSVVIATGHCDTPFVPPLARSLPEDVVQVVPGRYRNPRQLPEGGVLVVGASSTGVQLADEIHASGRPVTLAVGRHTRLPRTYRGRDILWWLDAMGVFDEAADQVFDLAISRGQPSLQLVGRPDRATLDLPTLQGRGVRLVGRAAGAEGARVAFADDLVVQTVAADARLARLVQRIDVFAARTGLETEVGPPEPFQPFFWPAEAPAVDRPPSRGHPDRGLGHGVPPPLPVAEGARARRGGRDPPRGRRHAPPRPLRDRALLPAAPQVELHRRRRSGCHGPDHPPRRPPATGGVRA